MLAAVHNSQELALTWLAELGFEENEEMKKMKVKGKEWLENPKETINSPPGRRPPSSVAGEGGKLAGKTRSNMKKHKTE